MATVKELKATARPAGGKGAARAERRAGRVPGVIYGNNQPPVTISVDDAELRQRILAGRFLTTIYDIDLEGKKHRVIPRDFHLDPVRDFPLHVDFMRLGEGATIRVSVPLHIQNAEAAPGVKRGGTVNIVTHTIDLECSVDNIPQYIEADVSESRNQPFAASVRHQAAGRRAIVVARRRDAGDHRAAVRLRRRTQGGCGCCRGRSGCCCGCARCGSGGRCRCSGGRCRSRGGCQGARGRRQSACGRREGACRRRQEEVTERGMPRHATVCWSRQSRREIRA